MGLLDRLLRRTAQPAGRSPATPPAPPAPRAPTAKPGLPEATREVSVTEAAFYRAAQPAEPGPLRLELLLLAKRPPELSVRWNGRRIGSVNPKTAAYLAPLIQRLAPESRRVAVDGAAAWEDDGRVLVVRMLVPDAAAVTRILAQEGSAAGQPTIG